MFARKGEMRGLPIRYRGKTRRGGCNVLGLYGLRASALTIVRRSGALSAMLTGTDREAHGGATWTMVARPRATYRCARHRAMGAAARAAGIGLRSPFSTPQRGLFSECGSHLWPATPLYRMPSTHAAVRPGERWEAGPHLRLGDPIAHPGRQSVPTYQQNGASAGTARAPSVAWPKHASSTGAVEVHNN